MWQLEKNNFKLLFTEIEISKELNLFPVEQVA